MSATGVNHRGAGGPNPQPQSQTQAQSQSQSQAPVDETRQHIIASLFNRRGPDGLPEETLIAYLKVYEDEEPSAGEEPKTRYLMLAGGSCIHSVYLFYCCFE